MIVVFVEVEIRCPLRCAHCSSASLTEKTDLSIDYPNLDLFFERVCEFLKFLHKYEDTIAINVFGGEPLLVDIDILLDFLKKVKSLGIKKIWLPTSLMISQEKLERIQEVSKYATITTSFDPIIRFKNYSEVQQWVQNYKFCLKEGLRPSVEFVVTPYLMEFPVLDFVKSIDCSTFEISPLIPIGRALQNKDQIWVPLQEVSEFLSHISAISEDFRKHYVETLRIVLGVSQHSEKPLQDSCYGACWNKFYIKRNGTVLVGENCVSLSTGNILLDSPESIYFSPNRYKLIDLKTNVKECQECEYFSFCLGECPTVRKFRKQIDKSDECYGLKNFLKDIENWSFKENWKKFPLSPKSEKMKNFVRTVFSVIEKS